jgi:hypothetical protein
VSEECFKKCTSLFITTNINSTKIKGLCVKQFLFYSGLIM